MPEVSKWIIVTCLQRPVAAFGHLFVVNISECPRAKQGKEGSPSIILKAVAVEGRQRYASL